MTDNDFDLEIATVYNDFMQSIQNIKNQQWQLTYYCLLLLGAVYAVRENNQIPHLFLISVTFAITITGLIMLLDLEKSLTEHRIKAQKILDDRFKDTIDYLLKKRDYKSSWNAFFDFSIIFAVTIILTFTSVLFAYHVVQPFFCLYSVLFFVGFLLIRLLIHRP